MNHAVVVAHQQIGLRAESIVSNALFEIAQHGSRLHDHVRAVELRQTALSLLRRRKPLRGAVCLIPAYKSH